MMILSLTASGAEEDPWSGASGMLVLTSKTTSAEFLSTATSLGFGLSLPVLKYMLFPSSATLWALFPPPWTLASNFHTGFCVAAASYSYRDASSALRLV